MKKIVLIALAAVFALALAGCACSSTASSGSASSGSTSTSSASADKSSSSASASGSAASASASSASASASSAAASSAAAQSTSASQPASSPAASQDGGQNPVMNYVGRYASGRANVLVEAAGQTDARITVEWGSGAATGAVWTLTGPFDANTLTVRYTNGTKVEYEIADGGEKRNETTVYTDGTGTITFTNTNPLSFTWADDKEHVADGMTFEFAQ